MLHKTCSTETRTADGSIDFLWLELTNQCNLRCSHCYAESGPYAKVNDLLVRADYEKLIIDGFNLGCKQIQFIGGEPTLNRDLPYLIKLASNCGYTFIEVFTNLTSISDELLECFKEYDVRVATSVYAPVEEIHDQITQVKGSFNKTSRNIIKLLKAGITMRAGVIEMEENSNQVEATINMLKEIGIENVGGDRLRHVGRGKGDKESALTELCGGCAGNTLCVSPNGLVSPCIMSKNWSVGSIVESPLALLAKSERLSSLRSDIYHTVVEPRESQKGLSAICTPKTCGPYDSCTPKWGPGPCEPRNCNPCYPMGITPSRRNA